MAGKSVQDLVDILQSRNLTANVDELENAFRADQDGAIQTWTTEHLNGETLLTREELALYAEPLVRTSC